MGKIIHAADLFCGAGGTSTGLAMAAERLGLNLNLIAVNHWDRAVETHSANHPFAGNKGEVVKQIGNSVPVRTARALCESRLAA